MKKKMQESEVNFNMPNELNVSFGYQCNSCQDDHSTVHDELSRMTQLEGSKKRSGSFSCLSGAALSANVTLGNTNICSGRFVDEILPRLDSPTSFRRMKSSPSLSRMDLLPANSHSAISAMAISTTTDTDMNENSENLLNSMSAPAEMESSSFLYAVDVQMAGGAAGEDRVQAVCSEENGWLFCGIYDGFNGRDAADFLAGILYEKVGLHLHQLELLIRKQSALNGLHNLNPLKNRATDGFKSELSFALGNSDMENSASLSLRSLSRDYEEFSGEDFVNGVLDSLTHSLAEAESEFMSMVEETMEDRPDLVSTGSCVLTVLLHGRNLYVMNLGDSRAVLASSNICGSCSLKAIALTETHTVDNVSESMKIVADHPDDLSVISAGRLKGKLKLTRAFGVGYLKKSNLNDALMGILRVRDLQSPPYVNINPFSMWHRVSENDLFVVLGSDGLFDFFTNDEVVQMVHHFIQHNPFGDPAKHLIENLILRAAENAGFSTEELMRIPAGRRRKYHDDVSVIVIILGNRQRTSKASTVI
ncbi:putative protein phosphatase 2C 39 [Apostasia shenzhenica]|uniref:protein-serine/threonine phosphatase n=1 Tax=Apostasia shenzhenica TaxID=1088818 RepID=A0A2I0AMZ2_9ASPA|nr:putative protein phosphatase 2C 39 [Apostasia shenzhenica]